VRSGSIREDPASLLEGSRKDLVHTRADKGVFGRIRTIAFQELPSNSGGHGSGVRERSCKRLSVGRAHEQLLNNRPLHLSW
jgi:hypothetical protein